MSRLYDAAVSSKVMSDTSVQSTSIVPDDVDRHLIKVKKRALLMERMAERASIFLSQSRDILKDPKVSAIDGSLSTASKSKGLFADIDDKIGQIDAKIKTTSNHLEYIISMLGLSDDTPVDEDGEDSSEE